MTAPDRITLYRRIMSDKWHLSESGETMSHANAEYAKYTRTTTLAEALAVPTWHPIETAPKDGMNFLAWFPSRKRHCVAWRQRHWIDGDLWASFLDAYPDRWSDQPTHWMPLPEPPAALRAIGEGR